MDANIVLPILCLIVFVLCMAGAMGAAAKVGKSQKQEDV